MMTKDSVFRQEASQEKISIFLAFVVGWCLFVGPWGTYTQIAFLTTFLTIPLFIGLFYAICRLILNRESIGLQDYDLVFIFVIFLAAISKLWTLYEDAWAVQFFWLIANFALYVITKSIAKSAWSLRMISIFGLLSIFVSFLLIGEVYNEWGIQFERSAIEGHNSNFTAYAICSAIGVAAIYLASSKSNNLDKLVFSVFVVLSLYVIELLGTRGAQISIVAICLALLVPIRFSRLIFAGEFTIFVIISGLIVSGLADPILGALDGASARSDGDLAGRIPTWRAATELVNENLFLGIGPGSFQEVSVMQINPHNFLFSVLLDWGLIGTILFVIWFIIGYNRIRLPEILRHRVASVFLAYAAPIGLSGEWIFLPQTWVVFGVFFGLTSASASLKTPQTQAVSHQSKAMA